VPSPAAVAAAMRPAALRIKARQMASQASGGVACYHDDPVGFARDCFHWPNGYTLSPYQEEVLGEVVRRRRVALRGPHGLGKTADAAIIILWFALTRDACGEDWKVVTTASAWRQLTKFLWPEVHKWARRLDYAKLGRAPFRANQELLQQSLSLKTGEAFAVASNDPTLIEGAHADSILYLFDESKSIPAETFDAAEGALSTGDAYAVALSTPGEPNGRFYDINSRKPGYEDWWVRAVTLQECIAAGRVAETWAEQRRRQWGETSAVYQNRVLGQFASSESDGVIPLSWVEAANERWHQWAEAGKTKNGRLRLGVDVGGGGGGDQSVHAFRYGRILAELRAWAYDETMETTGRIVGVLRHHAGEAVIDVIGIGAGVVNRVREQGYTAVGFNAAETTPQLDLSGELGFTNKRSAAWWQMRERLDPASGQDIALPPDDMLTGDLTAPHWRVVSGGCIQVESKDELRKPTRLGRSTDHGDAVIMAFWEDTVPVEHSEIMVYDEQIEISPY
jgi:hypothetical protein